MTVTKRRTPVHVARVVWEHATWAAGELVRHGRPRELVHFYGQTPGDDLMCTAVLHEMRRRGRRDVWMMSRFPELFERNPDVDVVVPFDERYERLAEWVGGRSWYAHYGGHDHEADRSPNPERHIIALMCQACDISGPVTLRPYLHLSADEREIGRIGKRQIALHSSGQSAFSAMKNKEWLPERMPAVVNALRGEFTLVQLGAPSDPPLHGCVDLRGRTSVRESAAVIANSELFLGQVGFLMHLARAVDRPAVIIYGGREKPWQSGYSCNTNLATTLPCSPCWRWNACDNVIERRCMKLIGVDEVVSAVRERAARSGEPLVEDTDDIPTTARAVG
jgi:ADP-heptose:LPS heptosyltransferase